MAPAIATGPHVPQQAHLYHAQSRPLAPSSAAQRSAHLSTPLAHTSLRPLVANRNRVLQNLAYFDGRRDYFAAARQELSDEPSHVL